MTSQLPLSTDEIMTPDEYEDSVRERQHAASQRRRERRATLLQRLNPLYWLYRIGIRWGGMTCVVLALCGNAGAMSWYDGFCCNEQDCRQTVLHEVERRDDGWFVSPALGSPVSFKPELIPFTSGKIRRSLDPLIHICVRGGAVICIYVPEVPV